MSDQSGSVARELPPTRSREQKQGPRRKARAISRGVQQFAGFGFMNDVVSVGCPELCSISVVPQVIEGFVLLFVVIASAIIFAFVIWREVRLRRSGRFVR